MLPNFCTISFLGGYPGRVTTSTIILLAVNKTSASNMTKDLYFWKFKGQVPSAPANHRPRPPQDPDGLILAREEDATSAASVHAETLEPLPAGSENNNKNNNNKSIIVDRAVKTMPQLTRASADDRPLPSAKSVTPIPLAFEVINAGSRGAPTEDISNDNNNGSINLATAPTQNSRNHNQKPFPWKNVIAWALLMVMVVAGAVVGGVCGYGGCGGGEATASARTLTITNFVNSNSYLGVDLSPTGTLPEERALHWIIHDDPLHLDVSEGDALRILQRYSLLTLWFQGTTGMAWIDSTNWLTKDECSWHGIGCKLGVVTQVELWGNGLQGKLSPDLGLLSDLSVFNLNSNSNLSGSLPSEIGLWISLTYFDCSLNSISGTLSTEIGLWTSLGVLNLGYNILTGSLPSEIGLWTSLTHFDVSSNSLTGAIPETIASWPLIDNAIFDKNNFVGSVPVGICEFISGSDQFTADCELNCSCCTFCT